MANIFEEVDANIPSRRPKAAKQAVKTEGRRKVRVLSPPLESKRKARKEDPSEVTLPDTPPAESTLEDEMLAPLDDGDVTMSDPVPSSPTAKAVERKTQVKVKMEDEDEEDADMMEIAQAVGDHAVKAVSINISGSRPAPKELKKPSYPTPESSSPSRPPPAAVDNVDPASWNDVTAKLNVLSSPPQPVAFGKLKLEDAVEADGSLRFFWTDFIEVNGSLCLFGKVQNKKSKAFVSGFLKIDNILRKLFFLPREYKKSALSVPVDLIATDGLRKWPGHGGRS